MRYIKTRNNFLSEAKIKDVIYPRQAKAISEKWGEKYLEYEEVTPTENIKVGKWKLSDEDKNKALGAFFGCDMEEVYKEFKDIPEKFSEILLLSIDESLLVERNKVILKNLNIKSPTIDQIMVLGDSNFRKLAVAETVATEMVEKDENGRPVMIDGKISKIAKDAGDPVFTRNLVDVTTMMEDFNRIYQEHSFRSDFRSRSINSLRSLGLEDHNRDYKVDFEIFNRDIYLSITHNPRDILNMSISKFYSSCQHLYSGSYRQQLLGNVFDPNSIPAFLCFDTPIFWGDEVISNQLPLSRLVIRNIENFDVNGKTKLFLDRAYPDRMKEVFDDIVIKYSDNKPSIAYNETDTYIFTPDIDSTDSSEIKDPYMDRLGLNRMPMIGKNTKILYLNRLHDWSNIKISKDAKIKELIVETTDIPSDLTKVKMNIDWIKFKYLTIDTISNFSNINSKSIAFDKCKFSSSIFDDSSMNDIKKLQIVSCDVTGDINLSSFKNLEEVQFIYTFDSFEPIPKILEGTNIKKLVISGDLSNSVSKPLINSLRKRNIKVEIVGPVI